MNELIATYPWALPLIIFCGRICDVSIGTLRIVFVSRGEKRIAPFIGFVEVFIWIVIISQVLAHANSLISYLSYAGGYAAGTFIGLLIEEKIGFGFVVFRVFMREKSSELAKLLNQSGYGSTIIHGEGSVSEIDIVEAVVSRKNTRKVEKLINSYDKNAFYLVEDIRAKQKGIFKKGPVIPTHTTRRGSSHDTADTRCESATSEHDVNKHK